MLMESENIDYSIYIPDHPKRLKVYEKFKTLLENTIKSKNEYDYNDIDIMKIALNLERGIFNYTLHYNKQSDNLWNDSFRTRYIHRSVTIYTNLDPNGYLKNTSLMKRLLKKELDEFQLTKLAYNEIFPERWNELISKYSKELLKDLPVEKEHEDGILQCGKCKSFKTEYTEIQTRSADESSTKLCYCWSCGRRWKFC